MFQTITRTVLTAVTLLLVTDSAHAQTQTLGIMVNRSCVATEYVKWVNRMSSLPPSAVPAYSRVSEALQKRKERIFEASARIDGQRAAKAWKTVGEVFNARPSLLERLIKAVLHDHPQLQRRQKEFEDKLVEYASVDPELLREVNRRLHKDVEYDILLAGTLRIGDRIDQLELEQIYLNEAIPVHWHEQEKVALRAAREFAEKSKQGQRLLEGFGQNPIMLQALSIAAALEAQTNGALPEDFRPIQSEGIIVKGAVVGLPMPEIRSFIRAVDSTIRRAELRLHHLTVENLGDANARAEMMTSPARLQTRTMAQKIVGKGVHELLLADVASRKMREVVVLEPPDLSSVPPAERDRIAQEFVKGMENAYKQEAEEGLSYEYFLEEER